MLTRALQNDISPKDIAFISFTNKAVDTAAMRALKAFPQYTSEDFYRFKTLHKYCRRYFEEDIFDPKDCMVDFALQTKIIKQSDKRLADDNFTYLDWSLGIYSKSRNMLSTPEAIYKKDPQSQSPEPDPSGAEPSSDKKDDKVVDAEFEEVDENKKE